MPSMDELGFYFGMHPFGAVAIVVSTVLLYLVFSLILSRFGQRLYASPSSLELAIVTVLGAIVGRSILGQVPTLGGGLLALATLLCLEAIAGRVRRGMQQGRRQQHRATAIVVDGHLETRELTRLRLDESSLWAALRGAGVCDLGEVALAVLEANGRISVLRTGQQIHPATLTGVRHSDELLRRLNPGRR
ncbi:uncharacterized protein DUF421 [Enemella evansiae]|nr:uncharacterized protein DUF421 [Enemella evansiae]